jgi:hypothetical protein
MPRAFRLDGPLSQVADNPCDANDLSKANAFFPEYLPRHVSHLGHAAPCRRFRSFGQIGVRFENAPQSQQARRAEGVRVRDS